jgi:acetylornithine deacetylase/succinyl-diaminopimelate desuccinylase-like protein
VLSAGFAHNVVVAHNGCLHLEVTVAGRSAHAARPDTGVDALEAATHLLNAVYAHRAAFSARASKVPGIGAPSLVVGLIKGGINTNVVPDLVSFRIDRRIVPEEIPEQAEAELRGVIETAAAELPEVKVSVERILLARPLGPVPGQDRLAGIVQRHAQKILGEDIPIEGVPIYTDARLYSAAGIPTILYGAGPRTLLDANGHRADENLRLSDLLAATKVVALALADLLAPPPQPSSEGSRPDAG